MKKILQKNKQIETLLYSGTSNGFGAIATAYAAFKLGLKSKVFINGHDTNNNGHDTNNNRHDTNNNRHDTRQINTLLALNAEVNLCPTYAEARDLKYSVSDAPKNINTHYNVPMGLNDENNIMTELLSRQITLAARKTILKNSEYTRIWLVGGSGGIAMSIHRAFPAAKLFILLTGAGIHKRKVIEWAKKTKNISLIKDLHLENTVTYYSSVKNYDDLIVPYVIKYGRNNDFIWNVSSDDYLFL
jgi:hypothetical protein